MSAERLLPIAWQYADENARLELLRTLEIPFPANNPIESAKQALLNLTDVEWTELWDWLDENHWLPHS